MDIHTKVMSNMVRAELPHKLWKQDKIKLWAKQYES